MIFLGPTYQCELWFVISYVWKESRYKNWFCWFVIAYIKTITRLSLLRRDELIKRRSDCTIKTRWIHKLFWHCTPRAACSILHPLCCNLPPQFQYHYVESQEMPLYVALHLLLFSWQALPIFWETLIILDLSFVLLVEVAQVNKTICSPL